MSKSSSIKLIQDHGGQISLAMVDMSRRRDRLAPGLYKNPEINEATGYITLDKADKLFEIPSVIYGKSEDYADLIMQDYDPVGEPIGVLLIGTKGMGKSMLAEMLSMRVYELKYPVIHITRRINPETIPKLLDIVGPCVLYMEEFEKCFNRIEDVPVILNTLSDSTLKGCMFIISANTLDTHLYDPLLNRPQRLKYRINYGRLDKSVINQILADHQITEAQKSVYLEWALSSNPNIDSLITLVRMTGHITDGADLVDFISILNVPNLNNPRYESRTVRILDWSFKVIRDYPYTLEIKTIPGRNAVTLHMQGQGFNKQAVLDLPKIEEDRTDLDLEPRLIDVGDEDSGTITFEVTPGITRSGEDKTIKVKVPLDKESVDIEPLEIVDEYVRNRVYTSGLEWYEI